VVTPRRVAAWLGVEQHQEKTLYSQPKPGLVYRLAWTESGGTLLPVEVALLEGSGELILTGSLGEVMKESAQTRPSAGVAITTALLSAARGVAVHPGHTMTGEITLTGRILPVGGIKEKVLAAHRNPFIHVLLPEGNRKDIEELPREVRSAITFLFSETIQDALVLLFPPAS